MSSDVRWRRDEENHELPSRDLTKKSISSLDKKVERRKFQQAWRAERLGKVGPGSEEVKASQPITKDRARCHMEFMQLVTEAHLIRGSDDLSPLGNELSAIDASSSFLLRALKLSRQVHKCDSFWQGYLHGSVGETLWNLALEKHQTNNFASSREYLDQSLEHFAAFEAIFTRRREALYLPCMDMYDWESESDTECPLWVLYCYLLKCYSTALGFKIVGLLPILETTDGEITNRGYQRDQEVAVSPIIRRSPEFKSNLSQATPTKIAKKILQVIIRGSSPTLIHPTTSQSTDNCAPPNSNRDTTMTNLSAWARRTVAMALGQSYDFLTNPIGSEYKEDRETEDQEATALMIETNKLYPTHSCDWSKCQKKETFHGQFAKCGRCHTVRYCCKEHQALDWRMGKHRKTCTQQESRPSNIKPGTAEDENTKSDSE